MLLLLFVVVVVECYCILKIIIDVVRGDDAVGFRLGAVYVVKKNLILSSQNGTPQNEPFCCQAPVEAPRPFLPFFRSRRGFALVRKGHLSSTPQKCHPCRSSCMSQIIQKRKGNHTTHINIRPPRRFSRPLSHFLALGGGTFLIIFLEFLRKICYFYS